METKAKPFCSFSICNLYLELIVKRPIKLGSKKHSHAALPQSFSLLIVITNHTQKARVYNITINTGLLLLNTNQLYFDLKIFYILPIIIIIIINLLLFIILVQLLLLVPRYRRLSSGLSRLLRQQELYAERHRLRREVIVRALNNENRLIFKNNLLFY